MTTKLQRAEAAARARSTTSYRETTKFHKDATPLRTQADALLDDRDDPSIAKPLRSKSADLQRGTSATVSRDLATASAKGVNSATLAQKVQVAAASGRPPARDLDEDEPSPGAYRSPDDELAEVFDSLAAAEEANRQRSAAAHLATHGQFSREAILGRDDARRQGHRADAIEHDDAAPTTNLKEAEERARQASRTAYLRPWKK